MLRGIRHFSKMKIPVHRLSREMRFVTAVSISHHGRIGSPSRSPEVSRVAQWRTQEGTRTARYGSGRFTTIQECPMQAEYVLAETSAAPAREMRRALTPRSDGRATAGTAAAARQRGSSCTAGRSGSGASSASGPGCCCCPTLANIFRAREAARRSRASGAARALRAALSSSCVTRGGKRCV